VINTPGQRFIVLKNRQGFGMKNDDEAVSRETDQGIDNAILIEGCAMCIDKQYPAED